MFERAHHRRIANLLTSLDADLLSSHACLFGGGTAMALRFGEYRESVDVDFLVSDLQGYRGLRQRVTGPGGLQALARQGALIDQTREVRADQYGLRSKVHVDGFDIKFEIVLEARITLEPPSASDEIRGVATLTALDMAASKLLANSDRWADDPVNSRDLIDLAMMMPTTKLLDAAVAKASAAYGASIERDLAQAIERLRARDGRLDQCMQALRIDRVPRALVWSRIRKLMPSPAAPR